MSTTTRVIEVTMTFRWGYDQTISGTYTFEDMADLASHVVAFIGPENLVSIVFHN
jgi:hypothetical protein